LSINVSGSILFKCMSLEADRMTEHQEKVLSVLEEKFPDLPPREEIISALQETQSNTQGVSIEEVMLKDLKEISDGEIKVAISTVYMTLEDCVLHRSLISDLKAFIDKYGFDVLVILANCLSDEKQTKQQIAVYSENVELGNQICCELEECQNPCLELDPLECECDQILIYHQENSSVTCDQILLLIKEVINRRQPEMVSNSRTSSTEAVAGSAPLSQGSSGIMELYGSDVEPQPTSANFIENPQDLNGSVQAHIDVNVDLVSPDSGLATIRSSRSSKESSVFLSDDSPVAEGAASHHSLLPGFDSYSPIPEGAIAEEQKSQSGSNSDNFDLFNFDLAPMVTAPSESSSRSVDCSPADDYFLNSDSSEGHQLTLKKKLDEINLLENDAVKYSTDLLTTKIEEDNLAEFDENPGEMCEKTSGLTDFVEGDSSSPEALKSADSKIPPTPMNSLVDTSPLDNGQPLIFSQDVIKKINEIESKNYSPSRVRYGSWWDGFDLDSRNADAWSSSEQESVFQSPVLLKDSKESPLLREHTDRRASDSVFLQKQPKQMEYMKADLWDNQFKEDNWNHENQEKNSEHSCLQTASLDETKQEVESFTDLWKVSQPTPVIPDAWCSGEGKGSQLAGDSYKIWTEFDEGNTGKSSEDAWNMPKLDRELKSVNIPEEWAVSKTGLSDSSEITVDNEIENPEVWDKGRYYSIEDHGKSENITFVFNNMQKNSKLNTGGKALFGDPEHRPKQFENIDTWNMYDKNMRKEVTEVVVPWEDTFLDKNSDLSSSNIAEDLVVSPPDTNYSTSDSYISPTYVEDERENEDKDFDEGTVTGKFMNTNLTESKVLEKSTKEPLSHNYVPFSNTRNADIWNTPLNNITQLQERNAEMPVLSASAKPCLNSEQTADLCFSTDTCSSENNFPVSESRRVILAYNQTVNDLSPSQNELNTGQRAADEAEAVGSFPVEDTNTSTPTSENENGLDLKICDLGSEILSKNAAQTTARIEEELGIQDSVHQLDLWGLQGEQGCEEGWDNATAISEEGEECKRTHVTSEQQMIDDICNKPVQEGNESSGKTDLEENESTTEVATSPEKQRSSVSLEVLITENHSCGSPSQDEELAEAHFTDTNNDENPPAPLYSDEKENERLLQSINSPDGQINEDISQFNRFDSFTLHKEKREMIEQLFSTNEENQLTPQNLFSDEEQAIPVEAITVLDLPKDNEENASLTPQGQQEDTCERVEVHNSMPGAFTVEDLSFEMAEKSSPEWNILVPQTALIPDILQDNTQGSNQQFSVEPDLWTNAEEIVTLKSDGENPDILSHCDQDNGSESSSSPDVCQEYGAKHASIPSSQVAVEPEDKDSQPIHTKSNVNKEADFDSKCQLVMQNEMHSENGSPQNYEPVKASEFYQLISSNPQEPPEFAVPEEYSLESKLVLDPFESTEIASEVTKMTSLDVKDMFHGSFTSASHQGAPADTAQVATSQMHLLPIDFNQPDREEQSLKEISASGEVVKYSGIDDTTITGVELDRSEECVDDSDTGMEHSIRDTSVTNGLGSTCGGMNILTLLGSEAAEGKSEDERTLFPKSFLSGGSEGDESDSNNQLFDDTAKEYEAVIENYVPVLKEIPNDQSPTVCTPPSSASFDAEPSGSRDNANGELLLQQRFYDSVSLEKRLPLSAPLQDAEGILMTEDEVSETSTECLEKNCTSVPSLSISEVTAPESDFLTGKSETETTDPDSPQGGDKRSCDAGTDSLLCREEKLRNSQKSPELESTDSKEDVRMQVLPASLEMDYILVTEEEKTPATNDTLERSEISFAFQESHEGFSPGSLDAFQAISISNESKDHLVCGTGWDTVHLEEKNSSAVPQKLEGERKSQESCGQDEGWIILGQNEISDISPEEVSAKTEMQKSGSGHPGEELASVVAQELILDTWTEFQVETPLQKSFEHEGCSPSDGLAAENVSLGIAGTSELQIVGGDCTWEANSQQRLGNNVATEQEMKVEMVLLNSDRELSKKSG
ncbi:PRUN2 protein, partial [Emberiza fucata]|nr:PRUN2 protein [Emberiza fucata]